MSDVIGKDVPPETAQAWDSVRRVREPVAWILLVTVAVVVFVSALQLFGLANVGVPTPSPGRVTGTTFEVRASIVAPQFVTGGLITLPVLAVVLVAFAGGLTERARQVVRTAVSIQAVAVGLGLISWVMAIGTPLRNGSWFVFYATALAAEAAALIFNVAVFRSQALRTLTPQLADSVEEDEDFGEED
jgi:hypothetical protein